MSHFLMAFKEIDRDGSGEITVDELRQYMIEQDYEDRFVDKFLSVFGITGNGSITLEAYCETLGIVRKANSLSPRIEILNAKGQMKERRITYLQADMPKSMQRAVLNQAHQAMEEGSEDEDIAENLKRSLDFQFHRAWQVIVGRGPYGSFVTNETEKLFHFKIDDTAFLIWRTPDF